jgi:hypothetical protein
MTASIHSTTGSRNQGWASVISWMFLHRELIERLPEQVRAQMSEWEKKYAESEEANVRIQDLAPSAHRQHSPETKKAAKIVVAAMSALAFSAGAQILTSRLGYLSLPASLGMGSLAGVLADTKATQVMTRGRRKRNTQQALDDIVSQQRANPPVNEISELFYHTKTSLVLQVEGKNLQNQSPLDLGLAVGLSGAEYAMSLGIVAGLGLPGGVLFNVIAASLPVAMLWTAASIQSECFEMPEHDGDLIEKYLPYSAGALEPVELNKLIFIDEEVADAQREWEWEKALEERREKFVREGDSSGRLKNWAMAEADFKIVWLGEEKLKLRKECEQLIEQRLFKFKADLDKLPERFEVPAGTFSPQQVAEYKVRWVAEQTGKLREALEQELKWVNYKYNNKIKRCEEGIAGAQEVYAEACRCWEEEKRNSQGYFGNAA